LNTTNFAASFHILLVFHFQNAPFLVVNLLVYRGGNAGEGRLWCSKLSCII